MIGAIVGYALIGAFLLLPLVAMWRHVREDRSPSLLSHDGDRRHLSMYPSPLEYARAEYLRGVMDLPEFEAVVENYVAGRDCCPACGRFPVDRDGLCQKHRV